jgi:hypothetical protein
MSDSFLEATNQHSVLCEIGKDMKHSALNMTPKSNNKSPMETADIPVTQDSSHVEITNEDNAITFFHITGTVHSEFIPQGQTVHEAYYVEMLKRLREAVRREKPELWPKDWTLVHDNAPAHKTTLSSSFWPKIRLLK